MKHKHGQCQYTFHNEHNVHMKLAFLVCCNLDIPEDRYLEVDIDHCLLLEPGFAHHLQLKQD